MVGGPGFEPGASRSRTVVMSCPPVSSRLLKCPLVLDCCLLRVLPGPPRSSWFRDSVPRLRSRTASRMAELDEGFGGRVEPSPRRHRRCSSTIREVMEQIRRGRWAIPESSRMNANDRLSLDPLGRVEGGNRIVKASHVADVSPQPTSPDPLDELTQLGAIGYTDEVDSQAVTSPRLGRAANGPQRAS